MTKKQKKTEHTIKHMMVPKHELLSEEDAKKVVEKYGGKHLLLEIKRKDPALKIFDIDPNVGDIIKVTREDLTAKNTAYRVVIK